MMKERALLLRRLDAQQLGALHRFSTPAELVYSLGAVQAQDYDMAKWALGLRLPHTVADQDIEAALNEGHILRTHILRPTWHFVHPQDIRWMLQLTAPGIYRYAAHYFRSLELDQRLLRRCSKLIGKQLRDRNHCTRAEIGAMLEKAGIPAEGQRLGHIMIHAELEGLVCNGARKGKQHTYALLEERAPATAALTRDEALARLALRYFGGHGPATEKDFSWWSGLSLTDARKAIALNKGELLSDRYLDTEVWFVSPAATLSGPGLWLLPNFDEYTVAYSNRNMLLDAANKASLSRAGSVIFSNTLVVEGKIAGTWKRSRTAGAVHIDVTPFSPLTPAQHRLLARQEERLRQFLLPAEY